LLDLKKNISNELITLKANLESENELEELLAEIETNYGIPNKIVHLAASKIENIRFKDVTWGDFEKDITVSLKSIVIILSRFLPALAKEKRGSVVVMLSSYVAGVPPKALAHYTTIKYALLGLVKSLASEYGGNGIRINAVSPSMVNTKFLSNINEKLVEISAHNNPMKRNAMPSDIIPAINLLLGEDAGYINGVNLPITGGSVL
jgi:3-oxoacyl-[acyl-carrier protein] reductase